MFGSLGTPELLLILAIVVVLFGVGRVSRIGSELGSAVREFRKGLRGGNPGTTPPANEPKQLPEKVESPK
jgi:sec-independent protein translocase protein TatA